MEHQTIWQLLEAKRREIALSITALFALLTATFFWHTEANEALIPVKMSFGQKNGGRSEAALTLADEAKKFGVDLQLRPAKSSAEALKLVASGELDCAFIPGGIDPPREEVQAVAAFTGEPLHLFVRSDIQRAGWEALKGKRINLGPPESSTHGIALKVLELIGFLPGRDFTEVQYTFEELAELPNSELPDAVFASLALGSDFGNQLVQQGGYKLLGLPFADILATRNGSFHEREIPAYAYGVIPPVPEQPLSTVTTRLLIVTNKKVSALAIERLLEAIYDSDFLRRINRAHKVRLTAADIREYPVHPGVRDYERGQQPLLTWGTISRLQEVRSFIMSAGVTVLLLWKLFRKRTLRSLHAYFREVSSLEVETLAAMKTKTLNDTRLLEVRQRLTEIKSEVLEQQGKGKLKNPEQVPSLLAHITDARKSVSIATNGPIVPSTRTRESGSSAGVGRAA